MIGASPGENRAYVSGATPTWKRDCRGSRAGNLEANPASCGLLARTLLETVDQTGTVPRNNALR
jgi:hypothetical protein